MLRVLLALVKRVLQSLCGVNTAQFFSIRSQCSRTFNNLICCEKGLNEGCKTRNIPIQLVLQGCCKTSCAFLLPVFSTFRDKI